MTNLDDKHKNDDDTGYASPIGDAVDGDESRPMDMHVSRPFMDSLSDALEQGDGDQIHALVDELHPADLADVFETLTRTDRRTLLESFGDTVPVDLLQELEGEAQDEVYEILSNEQIASVVTELDTDDAVYVLEELQDDDREEVLSSLAADDRIALEESLSYPEDSAGRLMQRDLMAMPEFWHVGQAIDYLRKISDEVIEDFYDIFVVDPAHHPVGTIPVSRLLRSGRDASLGDIMNADPHLVEVLSDQEDVAYQFRKYHLISAGVIDASRRLVGVVTVDDVVEVIEEEAEEDILALAGVGDLSMNESVRDITRTRFSWLFVNLLTAILASGVISMFDTTIEEMVALAVLMPIVASMGGNAGTQTMTVAVRSLATKELGPTNAARMVGREFRVAALNGIALAIISGTVAWWWFDSPMLGGVFAIALVFNMMVAGLSGILIPMGLSKAGVDPAIASSVFVTTITDVFGFFAFLGLAAALIL